MAAAPRNPGIGHGHSCGICLEELNERNVARSWTTTPCGHGFHSDCLDEWFIQSNGRRCPLCIQAVVENFTIRTTQGKAKLILDLIHTVREIGVLETKKVVLVNQVRRTENGEEILGILGPRFPLLLAPQVEPAPAPPAPAFQTRLYELVKSKLSLNKLFGICLFFWISFVIWNFVAHQVPAPPPPAAQGIFQNGIEAVPNLLNKFMLLRKRTIVRKKFSFFLFGIGWEYGWESVEQE